MGRADGKAGAVRGAVAEAGQALAEARSETEGEQLELLPPLRASLSGRARDRAVEAVREHRRGRPSGSENKATQDVKVFVRRVFGDPLIEMARWAQHTPETLALELGCSKLEAYDRLMSLMRELRKMFYADAVPVDDDGRPVPHLIMQVGGVVVGAPGAPPPWVYPGGPEPPDGFIEQNEQNQSLIARDPEGSHVAGSHGEDK